MPPTIEEETAALRARIIADGVLGFVGFGTSHSLMSDGKFATGITVQWDCRESRDAACNVYGSDHYAVLHELVPKRF